MDLPVLQAVKIFGTSIVAFLAALFFLPVVIKILYKYQINKQIRTSESAPIFAQLHQKKGGTPTAGGVVIWITVLVITGIFWFHPLLNFIDRGETYLPIATILIAG